MSLASKALLFVFCLNAAVMMCSVSELEFMPGTLSGTLLHVTTTYLETNWRALTQTSSIANQAWLFVTVIWGALTTFFAIIENMVFAFPDLLLSLGAPAWLSAALLPIWFYIVITWVMHLLTGRSVEP